MRLAKETLRRKSYEKVIKDYKQSSELVGKAKDLLASIHGAPIILRVLAGLLGGEVAIDQMMESVVDLFCVEGKEERQRWLRLF